MNKSDYDLLWEAHDSIYFHNPNNTLLWKLRGLLQRLKKEIA